MYGYSVTLNADNCPDGHSAEVDGIINMLEELQDICDEVKKVGPVEITVAIVKGAK